MLRIALSNHSFQNIVAADAFLSMREPNDTKYDRVISNPPVRDVPEGLRWELEHHPAFRFGPPLATSDFNFIQLALACLKPGGTAALLVRMTPLLGTGKKRGDPRGVTQNGLHLGRGLARTKLLPNTSARCAILLLRAPTSSPIVTPIKLIAADAEFTMDSHGKRVLTQENQTGILSALHGPDPQPGFSTIKSIEELAQRDYSLAPTHTCSGNVCLSTLVRAP
jgi:type I restriction-modification system DNA methylase subunit